MLMKKVVAKFEIPYIQVMDETGKVDEKLMPEISDDLLRKMYENMIFSRVVDEICLKLQREGRLGVYAPIRGQEASQIGSAIALNKEDWFFPMYRDVGTMLTFGLPAEDLFLFFKGDERGMKIQEGVNIFPLAIPVASQIPLAVGAAMGTNVMKKKNAVLTHLGDGATSKADFLEGSNFAGVFKAPVVIICDNNQYAISVPRSKQTASETIAQKAIAFGFEGIQVDGNDVFAVYKVTKEALEKARSGKGPTFIEAITYRLADHTTADDARKYRKEDEVKKWEKRDPILRLEIHMKAKGLWSKEYAKKIREDAEKKVSEIVKKVEQVGNQPLEDLFKYLYFKMPKKLEEQLNRMKQDN
jgi:pyruvate dehydrogenase E1 component alpha subunit